MFFVCTALSYCSKNVLVFSPRACLYQLTTTLAVRGIDQVAFFCKLTKKFDKTTPIV